MIPMPADLYPTWGAMWGPEVHPQRPWWRIHRSEIDRMGQWIQDIPPSFVPVDGHGVATYWERVDGLHAADLEAGDHEHPLPAPPPMPGQVWVFESQAEMILYVQVLKPGAFTVLWAGDKAVSLTWPPTDGILVSGPTIWGRDIPWSPAPCR